MSKTNQPPSPPAPRRTARMTVHDVARVAGVSAMTVSRAVNTPERVPSATLSKVQEAIAAIWKELLNVERVKPDDDFVVLEDPDGNLFCVVHVPSES